ncbi:MAG: 50S ribosomal protein L18 [Deltaproteobacteria bacterium GWA2_38_16]|nr:MAG: 50S ribosomal protein L18 [Deltaproteobacteria bacterium GWA2_38_16]OGQ03797.1 MAG: 50S ribosomal protein L18 [Deltaproteobacteria bacterium RIFCSPHIGHO2_02_FULL_38_15]OGQ34309.1 MAG: 50S ribosomal protein L18 [Deltaproteobacteria bacterium RIFCSPLOWO2_01_FULL_38_9]OGQ59146.1 MAG: 50S ribosomal protein L18 [Deltaproteobacteria bacterium RIFCSPLOWO2_12_FULL_38_8]HBQ20838.1 50S ribosomal protein L18 [Deltaproteobacteria bacterium]
MSTRIRKSLSKKEESRLRRHRRRRGKIWGTSERPRLCVFRSQKHIYAQIIDDSAQKVLLGISTVSKDLDIKKGYTVVSATQVGETTAKKALAQKIKKVVFDVGGYKYHGRIKALAEGARKGGLQF